MRAKVLSDTIVRSFKNSDGNNIAYSDTPILLNFKGQDLILILRSNANLHLKAGQFIEFDPYIPQKQGSIIKGINIKPVPSLAKSGTDDV